MKNIGKPCAGKPHARFDEGGQAKDCSLLYPGFRVLFGMKNIGKPCAGKPHARFDEGGQVRACSLLYPWFLYY